MARNNIIKAVIVADTKNFQSGLDKTTQKMGEFGKTMTRRVSLPLAALGVAAIKMGSDLAEASSMASQVFGAAADDIVESSKNVTDSFSQEEYLSMAGNLGDIAQGMGFTAEASADLADTQAEKLESLVESLDFDDEDTFAAKVATVKNSYFSKTNSTEVIEESADDPSSYETEVETAPTMERYLSAIRKTNPQ